MPPNGLRDRAGGEKGYFDGTHRLCPPAETLQRLTPIAERIGITRVADLTGLDRIGIPVVSVCRPDNRSLSVYQGKGATLVAAKVSGVMESIERYCGEFARGPDFTVSLKKFPPGHNTIDFGVWPVPTDAARDSDAEIGWIAGYDLLAEQQTFVPHAVVHFDQRLSPAQAAAQFDNTSTGLACGNTFAEALVHAISEIIERDALTLWKVQPAPLKALARVALASIDDPICLALIAAIKAAGLACAVYDIRSEIDVPAFLCRIVETRDDGYRPSDIVDGAGCHPCREVALARAVTEAVQIRATAISGARNDFFRGLYGGADAAAVAAMRASVRGSRDKGREFDRCPTIVTPTSEDDLRHLLGVLSKHVRHVIAVDLTQADLGIPAVRVLVPELEDGEDMERYRPRARTRRAFLGRR